MGASNIKGITIEIDGETTKLSKALKDVDGSIKNTQSSLKEVNKLLKLDPGNTDLLTQKQKLLKDAIGETKDRLQTLRDAQSQVAKGSDEWNALQTEIVTTEGKLKSLEDQYKSFGSVAAQQIQAAGQKMSEFGDKVTSAGKAFAPISGAAAGGLTAAVKEAASFDAQMSKVQAISGASTEDMEALRAKAREMGAATKFSAEEAGQGLEYMAMAGWKTEQMMDGIQPILNLAAASGEELGTTSDIVTDALTGFGLKAEDAGHFADILAAASSNANTNVSMLGESFKYAAPVAGALGYSAEDVSVALGLMANSGIKASQAGTSLRNIFQRMAKPTKESEAAMNRLGVSMYNDEGQMYSFMDIMEQLRSSMGNIKMPTEEAMEQFALLDEQCASGAITEKQWSAATEELIKQTFGAEEAEKARAAAMLGGSRAMAGLLAITNASDEDFEKLRSAVENSSQSFAQLADGSIVPMNEALASGQEIIATYNGEAEKMSAVMLQNLPGALTILKSGISELAISIGEALMPNIQAIVAKVQDVVNWFNSLDQTQKQLIATILVVVAAISPVLIVLGTLISSVGNITTLIGKLVGYVSGTLIPAITAISAPVLIIIAVIAALGVALVALYATNEDFRNKVNAIWEQIKEVISLAIQVIQAVIQKFIQVVQAAWSRWGDTILNVAKSVWNFILTEISVAINLIKDVLNVVMAAINGDWTGVWNGIKQFITDLWNGIKQVISAAIEAVKTVIGTVLNAIKAVWDTIWNAIKQKVEEIWNGIKTTVSNLLENIKSTIGQVKETITTKIGEAVAYIKSLPEQALTWGRDLIGNFVDGIKEKIDTVKDVISDVGDAVADFIGFSEPDKGPLSRFHTFAPDMMKLYAQGIRDNMHLVTDEMNNLAGAMAGSTQRTATVNVTSNTYLDGRLITSAVNSELGAML